MLRLRIVLGLLCLLLVAVPVFAQDGEYTVNLSTNETLGPIMVGSNGMTLYIFTRDPLDASVCSGQCLENWPAVTVSENTRLVGGAGVEGELGTITRDDGALQVTYNGMPLYFWKDDHAPSDTTGQGVGDVWFVVAP